MIAAAAPRSEPLRERLLVVDSASGTLDDRAIGALPALLHPGDAVIVNDAATLPASLRAKDGRELRLVGRPSSGFATASGGEWGRTERRFRAVLFGAGDFRTPTERRPAPAPVRPGDVLSFDADLRATVTSVDPDNGRLVEVEFADNGAALYRKLYAAGHPVQYAHVSRPLALWDVQSGFASRPWAFEMPSAGRPLTFGVIDALRKRGITVAAITHGAGISSTGADDLDARLPLTERFVIGAAAALAVRDARARGGRVVAAGTTVVRALESAFLFRGELAPCEGEATLVIGPGFVPRVADAILTGMHQRGTSHFALLEAFAPRTLLERALSRADILGYLAHEFGDSMLVIPPREVLARDRTR